jgi:hypothetical protein
MSASSQTINARAGAISLRWIISAREDLVWFIGSVASSYALLILYVSGVLPLIPMVAGWAILIDAPHVFGTLSRTYFDASEWKTRKRLLLGSLLFFAVGPTLVLLGLGFTFFFVAALWAYYHLVKQHYGFMVLYKKKNNDLAALDNALDRGEFYLSRAGCRRQTPRIVQALTDRDGQSFSQLLRRIKSFDQSPCSNHVGVKSSMSIAGTSDASQRYSFSLPSELTFGSRFAPRVRICSTR